MYAEELKIQNAKKEADNAQRILTAEMANDLQKKRIELENESDKHALTLKIEYEKETQKLKQAEFETQDMLRQEEDKVKQQEFKHVE